MAFTYKDYEKSDEVKQKEEEKNQHLLSKPGEYQSQWEGQLDSIWNDIQNRKPFTYDLNGDALYQQYKDQYMTQGNQAMMDTMGQASALTGGYGNSYAQTVGQQTYQGYLQGLNDKVPELYSLAMEKYNQEGADLFNQYGLLSDKETQDYGRYQDSVANWQNMLGFYMDEANNAYNRDYGMYTDGKNFSYGQYRDDIADTQWQKTYDETVRQNNIANQQWQKEYDLQRIAASKPAAVENTPEWIRDNLEAGGYTEKDLEILINKWVTAGYLSETLGKRLYAAYIGQFKKEAPKTTPKQESVMAHGGKIKYEKF